MNTIANILFGVALCVIAFALTARVDNGTVCLFHFAQETGS
jgi:hypothetical protein